MESAQRKKVWRRFTIGTLLFVIFLIAGLFAGYRIGFRFGNDARAGRQYIETYNVADLLAVSNIDTLTDQITSMFSPDSWDDVGGNGTIMYFPANQSLVVSQRQDVHEQIGDLISQIRVSSTRAITQDLSSSPTD